MILRAQRQEPEPDPLLDALPQLAALGFDAVEDYVCWSLIEPEPGRFEFGLHREHQRAARAAGLGYHVYPWLHSMPAWAFERPEFVPATCLEHGRPAPFPSIFAPTTRAALEHFYARLAEGLGAVAAWYDLRVRMEPAAPDEAAASAPAFPTLRAPPGMPERPAVLRYGARFRGRREG